MIFALFTSFAGDTFLLFDEKWPFFFLLGLGSFLITHICYSLVFWRINRNLKGVWKYMIIPILVFAVILNAIWDSLETAMKLPVLAYSLSIFLMVTLSGNLKSKVPNQYWWMILGGALLFMFSDSLIAIRKFQPELNPFSQTQFWVMLTYLLGQFGIVVGMTKHIKVTTLS